MTQRTRTHYDVAATGRKGFFPPSRVVCLQEAQNDHLGHQQHHEGLHGDYSTIGNNQETNNESVSIGQLQQEKDVTTEMVYDIGATERNSENNKHLTKRVEKTHYAA